MQSCLTSLLSPDESLSDSINNYALGGHYAAYIGEIIGGRYVVKQRVEITHYSIVWLAFDCKIGRHVHLKIFQATPLSSEVAIEEISIMQKIERARSLESWQENLEKISTIFGKKFGKNENFCVDYQNSFSLKTAYSNHVVIVTEVIGISLQKLIKGNVQNAHPQLPLSVIKKAVLEGLLSLDFLHNYARIAHCGVRLENLRVWIPPDLVEETLKDIWEQSNQEEEAKLANHLRVMSKSKKIKNSVQDPKLDLLTQKQRKKYKRKQKNKKQAADESFDKVSPERPRSKSSPLTVTVEKNSSQPKPPEKGSDPFLLSIPEIYLEPLLAKVLDQLVIKICDFSNARTPPGDSRDCQLIQSRPYRPPEVILRLALDYPVDMWGFGCALYSLTTGYFLFGSKSNVKDSQNALHLAEISQICHRFSKKMILSSEVRENYFTKGLQLKIPDNRSKTTIDALMRQSGTKEDAIRQIAPIIEKCIVFDHIKRAKAKDLLNEKLFCHSLRSEVSDKNLDGEPLSKIISMNNRYPETFDKDDIPSMFSVINKTFQEATINSLLENSSSLLLDSSSKSNYRNLKEGNYLQKLCHLLQQDRFFQPFKTETPENLSVSSSEESQADISDFHEKDVLPGHQSLEPMIFKHNTPNFEIIKKFIDSSNRSPNKFIGYSDGIDIDLLDQPSQIKDLYDLSYDD